MRGHAPVKTTETELALTRLENAIKAVSNAWNTSEGRRGHISENRRELAEAQKLFEEEKETLLQEQWRIRKESATFQHARDEAVRLSAELEAAQNNREEIGHRLRHILLNVKILHKELQR